MGLVTGNLAGCRTPEAADGSNTNYCKDTSDSGTSNPPTEIVSVIAPTSTFVNFSTIITASEEDVKNELGFNLGDDELKRAVGRELSVVVADGSPKLAALRVVDLGGGDVSDIESEIKTTFRAFNDVAECAAGDNKRKYDQISTTEESDILGGLAIAADQFSSSDSKKIIYVLANGLQTAGSIKMQDSGQFPKSEKYATQLAKSLSGKGALPDLRGATVIWYGLGQVNGKDQKLDQKARDSLKFFWQEVIRLSNGDLSDANTHGQVGTGDPNPNAISSSIVNVATCPLLITLYERDGVQFQPNNAVFVDEASAIKKAKDVASSFTRENCDELTVHGYAAAGVDKLAYESKQASIDTKNKSLTLSRAKAFAALVKKAGFKGIINTEGVGTCGTEWTPTGAVDSKAQKLCRRVEVSN
jgi:hypothetical protein